MTGKNWILILILGLAILWQLSGFSIPLLIGIGIPALMIATVVRKVQAIVNPKTHFARSVTMTGGQASIGEQIVNEWQIPNSNGLTPWQLIQNSGGPCKFDGKATGFYANPNLYVITVEIQGLFRKEYLSCYVENLPNNRIRLRYEWTGNSAAIDDYGSQPYQLLTYLLQAVETEFEARGLFQPGARLGAKPGIAAAELKGGARAVGGGGIGAQHGWWRRYDDNAVEEPLGENWPNPSDYLESLQNPHLNFVDADLKESSVETDVHGLPKVASGAFASVFRMGNNGREWAVRCFNTKLTDQDRRYGAISKFVLQDDLSYTVDFNYVSKGIRCRGNWFPILKMNWVDGESLEMYVAKSLHKPELLRKLRSDFHHMMGELKRNGIAHGDLQHGNILVNQDSLYLVDYDGMYVPTLAGQKSNEIGHRNYQHPRRGADHFGPYLDNFSAHVIDISLLCLSIDPELFKFASGDECLLFKREDFTSPQNSKLIAAMKKHSSVEIRKAVERILSYVALPVERVPYLDSASIAPTSITIEKEQLAQSPMPAE